MDEMVQVTGQLGLAVQRGSGSVSHLLMLEDSGICHNNCSICIYCGLHGQENSVTGIFSPFIQ